jgi:hypothetical protein
MHKQFQYIITIAWINKFDTLCKTLLETFYAMYLAHWTIRLIIMYLAHLTIRLIIIYWNFLCNVFSTFNHKVEHILITLVVQYAKYIVDKTFQCIFIISMGNILNTLYKKKSRIITQWPSLLNALHKQFQFIIYWKCIWNNKHWGW